MNLERVKKLLNNTPLLKWVKKHTADGLDEDIKGKADTFDIGIEKDSVVIANVENTQMFFSEARFNGQVYAMFSLDYIKEAIDIFGKGNNAKIIIKKNAEDSPCYISDDKNVIVIAPRVETDDDVEEKEPVKTEETDDE